MFQTGEGVVFTTQDNSSPVMITACFLLLDARLSSTLMSIPLDQLPQAVFDSNNAHPPRQQASHSFLHQ